MTHPVRAPEPGTDADADATFRNWMRLNLARAAETFGLSVTGAPLFGWRLRSIGAVTHGPNETRWLRVVSEQPQWATGEFWTGNQDANTLTGLPKPVVLASTEWDEAGWRSQRAEVMTLLPGEPCSPSDVLRTDVELSDQWCRELRRSLHRLAGVPTTRLLTQLDQADVTVREIREKDCCVVRTCHRWQLRSKVAVSGTSATEPYTSPLGLEGLMRPVLRRRSVRR